MASIYKRSRIWWISFLADGKRVQKSLRTTSKKVAQESKKEIDYLEVTRQIRPPSKTPVRDFLKSCSRQVLLPGIYSKRQEKHVLSRLVRGGTQALHGCRSTDSGRQTFG